MRDTPPEVDKRYRDTIMALPPGERVRMGSSMFDAARTIVASGIRHRHPDYTEAQVRTKVFEAFYKDDFSPEELRKIVDALPPLEPVD